MEQLLIDLSCLTLDGYLHTPNERHVNPCSWFKGQSVGTRIRQMSQHQVFFTFSHLLLWFEWSGASSPTHPCLKIVKETMAGCRTVPLSPLCVTQWWLCDPRLKQSTFSPRVLVALSKSSFLFLWYSKLCKLGLVVLFWIHQKSIFQKLKSNSNKWEKEGEQASVILFEPVDLVRPEVHLPLKLLHCIRQEFAFVFKLARLMDVTLWLNTHP